MGCLCSLIIASCLHVICLIVWWKCIEIEGTHNSSLWRTSSSMLHWFVHGPVVLMRATMIVQLYSMMRPIISSNEMSCLGTAVISHSCENNLTKLYLSSVFRKKIDCTHLVRTTLTTNTVNERQCSLTESRYSIGSSKHQRRRSSEYHRAHHPRIPTTPSVPAARLSNYRTATLVYAQASKRMVQHQNSQASLLYGYPHHH